MNNEQYCGTTPILESEPINIPDAKKCRANHGLVAAVPCEDITFGIFKRKKAISENNINDNRPFKNVN